MRLQDMSGISQTLGIDLGAQPPGTAACRIEWSTEGGRILPAETAKLSNPFLREIISDEAVSHVAIDAPFGWPSTFVDAVTRYRETGTWSGANQRSLRFRKTDLHVREVTGRDPLSVTSDFLAFIGWRCAEILSEVSSWDLQSRRGEGRLIEIYPFGSMHCWGIAPSSWLDDPGSYKGKGDDRKVRRRRLVDLLSAESNSRLDFGGDEQRFIESDHELDALIAALTARSVSLGLVEPIPDDLDEVVDQEGWIRLPRLGSGLAEICG